MTDLRVPDEGDYLADFRVGVDFTVGARNMAEARALVEQTLNAEDSDGTQFVSRTFRRTVDDRAWGVADWQAVPPRPSQAALVQTHYPGLINDLAVVEALETVMRTGDRPVVFRDLLPQETRDRIQQVLDDFDPVVRVDDPDVPGRLVYEGRSREAAADLLEGVYRAFDMDDREYALVVAPSQLEATGRVSRAIPRERHDARTLDEIADILQQHQRGDSLARLAQTVSRKVETTRRTGLPPWMPLDEAPAAAASPAHVNVGTIVWSDLAENEPTILVDTNPVRLARRLATMLHETMQDANMFAGAAEFLDRHPASVRVGDPGGCRQLARGAARDHSVPGVLDPAAHRRHAVSRRS